MLRIFALHLIGPIFPEPLSIGQLGGKDKSQKAKKIFCYMRKANKFVSVINSKIIKL